MRLGRPRRRPHPGRKPLPPGFGIIWTTVAIDLVGFGIVLPILPIYARRFHTTPFQATLLVAAFSAASFVFSPLWGRVSDRFGRKPILLISLAGTAIGSLLTGLAGGLTLLLVGRIIDGASGASVSVAQAAAADLSGPSDRARLFGMLGAAFGVGFVAGPALGSLAALGGPRLPFFLAAGIATVNTVVAIWRLPETRPVGAQLVPALASDEPVGPSSVTAQVSGGSSVPVSGGLGAPSPGRLPLGTGGGAPGLVPLLVVAFCALVAFSGFEATFALFGQRHLGFGIASAAAVFTAVGVVIVVVQGGLVYRVTSLLGEVRTLVVGLLADAAGLALLSGAHSWALAAPALLALTVGQGLVQTTMVTILAARSDPARRGGVLGAQQSAGGLARVVGPALGGALLGSRASGDPYLVGCGLSLIAAALVVATAGGTGRDRVPDAAADLGTAG